MADEACVVRLARNRERTQTENRSNEQPQNQPRTIILIPHDIMISNIKFHLYDISYFQPIRDHLSFSWCCLDWLSTPPFIESYCYFTVPELSTGAQLNFFFFWRSKTWTESENHTSVLCNFFHHHLPRDISGVWTLSPLMKSTYTNSSSSILRVYWNALCMV